MLEKRQWKRKEVCDGISEREREETLLFFCSLSKYASQELNPGLLYEWQGPYYLKLALLPPKKSISRKLEPAARAKD